MKKISDGAYAAGFCGGDDVVKEIAVEFFHWWWNQPGANTEDGFDDWWKGQERCVECGATTPEEAETMCKCAGDKDDCHGVHLWDTQTRSYGKINKTDWRLFVCDQESGKEYLSCWGPVEKMRGILRRRSAAGDDVWLIAHDGTKEVAP